MVKICFNHHSLQTIDILKKQLVKSGIEFTEKLFKTDDGIDGLSGEIFVGFTALLVSAF